MSVIPQPASAPAPESQPTSTPGPTGSTGGTTAPPTADTPLNEIFSAKYDVQEPTFESVLTTTAADLQAARDAASGEFESVPKVVLNEEQRPAMAGKRYPGLTTVTRLMAHGLARHPQIVKATLVTPEQALEVIAQDDAATDLALAGDALGSGADDGAILVSATTQTLCQRILSQVQQARNDQDTPQDARSKLSMAFAQPERLQADRLQRLQAAKAQNQQSTQGSVQQTTVAQQTAAESRLVDAFGKATRNK